VPALEQFLGSSAGLSAATISRLTAQWQAGYEAFGQRDLSRSDYVYVWADGVHLKIRWTRPRPRTWPAPRSGHSRSSTGRSSRWSSRGSPMTRTNCSRSSTTRPSTGSICGRRIRYGSTFATVRLRSKVTKGAGSRAAALGMVFKLIESAQSRWRASARPTWSRSCAPEPLRARPARGAGSHRALTLRESGCLRRTRRAVIGDDTAEAEGGVMRREHEAVTSRL